jgi:hypothetical protein
MKKWKLNVRWIDDGHIGRMFERDMVSWHGGIYHVVITEDVKKIESELTSVLGWRIEADGMDYVLSNKNESKTFEEAEEEVLAILRSQFFVYE